MLYRRSNIRQTANSWVGRGKNHEDVERKKTSHRKINFIVQHICISIYIYIYIYRERERERPRERSYINCKSL